MEQNSDETIRQLDKAVAEIDKRHVSRRMGIWVGTAVGFVAYVFAIATINEGKGEGGFFAVFIILLISYGFAWTSNAIGELLFAQMVSLNRIWQRLKYPALLVVLVPFFIVSCGAELGIEKEVMTFDRGPMRMISIWILAPLFFMVVFPAVNVFIPPSTPQKEVCEEK